MVVTLDEALELMPSRYDDDEITDSITAYIRLDQHLVIRIHASIEARDVYHYYQYFTPGTQLKFGNTFVCCCSQSSESQRQVPDDRRRRIYTRMEVFSCNGSINGMIDKPNGYVRITIEHSTRHRAAPHAINNNVDEDIRECIRQKCVTMNAKDLYLDILNTYPNTMGTLSQSQV